MATVSDILAATFQHRMRLQDLKAKEAEGAAGWFEKNRTARAARPL